ncbi:MAG: hypothetical protein ACPGNV_05715 [Mangrovicoccus sp.]
MLREDVVRLIKALNDADVYVIGVNTGRLYDADQYFDAYFERRNFGRDFGSYRVGVIAAQKLAPSAERLLLLNDSVFYSENGLSDFVEKLLQSEADICSATESSEVTPHQPSFCLSFSSKCFQHAAFSRFWKWYVPSDLRPSVLLLGEIGLSRQLYRAGLSRTALVKQDELGDVLRVRPNLAWPAKDRDISWCLEGNVTHRAAPALLFLGLPLIKLDLFRRAVIPEDRISDFENLLPKNEIENLRMMLRSHADSAKKSSWLQGLGARCGLD